MPHEVYYPTVRHCVLPKNESAWNVLFNCKYMLLLKWEH